MRDERWDMRPLRHLSPTFRCDGEAVIHLIIGSLPLVPIICHFKGFRAHFNPARTAWSICSAYAIEILYCVRIAAARNIRRYRGGVIGFLDLTRYHIDRTVSICDISFKRLRTNIVVLIAGKRKIDFMLVEYMPPYIIITARLVEWVLYIYSNLHRPLWTQPVYKRQHISHV
jgi:hypothetical protein